MLSLLKEHVLQNRDISSTLIHVIMIKVFSYIPIVSEPETTTVNALRFVLLSVYTRDILKRQ